MKCPKCSYICGSSRTECPKCGQHLFGEKKEQAQDNAAWKLDTSAIPTSASIDELVQMEEAKKARETLKTATAKKAKFSFPEGKLVSPHDELPLASCIGNIALNQIVQFDPNNKDLAYLFSEAGDSLDEELFFEFSSSQMGAKLVDDEVYMLFELADESLANPEAAKRYIDSVEISSTKVVNSKFLAQQLLKVEQFFDAPILSLTGRGLRGKDDIVDIALQNNKPEAPAYKRFASAAIDSSLMIFTALFIVLCTPFLELGQLTEPFLYGLKQGDILSLLRPASIFTEIFLFSLVIYPLFSFVLFRSTVGMRVMNLLLIREGGGMPRMGNVLVRALTYPLSVLLLGGAPSLLGKRTLHDHIAKTRIVVF